MGIENVGSSHSAHHDAWASLSTISSAADLRAIDGVGQQRLQQPVPRLTLAALARHHEALVDEAAHHVEDLFD